MNLNAILDYIKDPYEQKARVFPALLVIMPILVPLLLIFGPKDPLLTALLGLVAGCGSIYALASIARGLGKNLEEKLYKRWGGMPTTLILRHRDTFLDSISKGRYHTAIKEKLGITLPSSIDEDINPTSADDIYIGATRQLREATRGKSHTLLLKENIAYGFHRNMMAVRIIGIVTCIAGIALGLILSKAIQLKPFSIDFSNLAEPGTSGGITLIVSIILLFAWTYFGESAVRRMGYVYAERLFESLNSLSKRRKASGTSK